MHVSKVIYYVFYLYLLSFLSIRKYETSSLSNEREQKLFTGVDPRKNKQMNYSVGKAFTSHVVVTILIINNKPLLPV